MSRAGDRLDAILASRRLRAAEALRERGPELRATAEAAASRSSTGRLVDALRNSAVPLIAEVKRRSPSAGLLARDGFDPVSLASAYVSAGAAAISVVVERDHFGGDPAWVPAVVAATGSAVLWKDFVVDETVLLEAAAGGASAALLIVAALSDDELRQLHARAAELSLDVLVEAHDAAEVRRAVDAGARIVGVNARDLRTFEVDLGRACGAAAAIPDGVVRVAESGIRTRDDVARLRDAGFDAFLVGETLVRSGDPASTIRDLFAR